MSWFSSIASVLTPVPSQLPATFCKSMADAVVAPLYQKNQVIAVGWKVDKLYYVQDFQRIADEVRGLALGAIDQAQAFKASGVDADMGGLNNQLKSMIVEFGAMPWPFSTGAWAGYYKTYTDALASGAKAIEAPDFKAWVLKVLDEIVKVQWWLNYTWCRQDVFSKGLDILKNGLTKLAQIVVAVVEAVVEVASQIMKVPGRIADLVGLAAKVAGVGAVGFVGFKLYHAHKARKGLPKGGA